jgi:hypothetical protein
MTARKIIRLATLASAAALLPGGAWAHPGHEHSPGWVAQLVHSITNWGPLLVVLVIAVAAGYRLWKSRDS